MKPTSASGIGLWKTCQRRWAFTYLHGRREPPGASALFGSAVHKVLETGETEGVTVEVAELADAFRPFLPSPNEILGHEVKFTEMIDGILFTGVIDLLTKNSVIDFKTTSKKKYVKSYKALEDDPQRLLYVQVSPDAETTTWLYGVREDNTIVERTFEVDRVKDRERFKLHVLKDAEEIHLVPPDVDPLSLPPNKASCGLYPPAGCPFKNDCFPSVEKVVMTKLLDKIKKLNEAKTAAAAEEKHEIPKIQATVPVEQVQEAPEPPSAPAPVVGSQGLEASGKLISVGESLAQPAGFGTEKLIDTLFVDCFPLYPLDVPLAFSHELLGPASQAIADEVGLVHARLVDFGKGPAMVAGFVVESLRNKPIKYLHLETKSPEGRDCFLALAAVSGKVIKGSY